MFHASGNHWGYAIRDSRGKASKSAKFEATTPRGTSRSKIMRQRHFFELSDAASEALSGGLEITAKNSASDQLIIVSTPKNPPENVYAGGPLEYTATTFPGSPGIDFRKTEFKLN